MSNVWRLLRYMVVTRFLKAGEGVFVKIAQVGYFATVGLMLLIFGLYVILLVNIEFESVADFAVEFRRALLNAGLNGFMLALIMASLANALLLIRTFVLCRIAIDVPSYDYEIILAQPLDISEYIKAHIIYELLISLLNPSTLFTLFMLSILAGCFTASKAKSLAALPALILTSCCVKAYSFTLSLATHKLMVNKKVYERARLGVILGLAVIASLYPLLKEYALYALGGPLTPCLLALYICFSISTPLINLIPLLGLTFTLVLLMTLLCCRLAREAGVEILNPVGFEALLAEYRKLLGESVSKELMAYNVGVSELLLPFRDLLFASLLFTGLAVAMGFGFVYARSIGGPLTDIVEFFIVFSPLIFLSGCLFSLIATLLENVVTALWILIVYSGGSVQWVREIMPRVSMYIVCCLVATSLFVSIVTRCLTPFLITVLLLPSSIALAGFILAFLTYMASRKKIVKYVDTAPWHLETNFMVMLVTLVWVIPTYLLYLGTLISNISAVNPLCVSTILLYSLTTIPIYKILVKLVEKLCTELDYVI